MSLSCERFRDLSRLRSALVRAPLALSSFFRISASSVVSSILTSGPVAQSESFFFGLGGDGAALGVGAGVGVGVGVGAAAAVADAALVAAGFSSQALPARARSRLGTRVPVRASFDM